MFVIQRRFKIPCSKTKVAPIPSSGAAVSVTVDHCSWAPLATRIVVCVRTVISSVWNCGVVAWQHLQISHRGKYSVERLQAFDECCQTTSLLRAVAVCALTPLPTLIVSGVVEMIPLQPVSEG